MENNNRKAHQRLVNQLHKTSLSFKETPSELPDWQQFLAGVNATYHADTKARKLLEQSLQDSSNEMHTLYEDLKEETEQRISAIQKSEEKMMFMANMSHEIRTPVHGILGSLDVVKETVLDERQKLFIDTAYVSCEALLDIINNILDYSKISVDKLELELSDFSLHDLVAEVDSIMSMADHDKDVDVLSYIPEDIPNRLRGDAIRIRQMLINLVGNALKFTEKGEVYTRIENKSENENEVTLRFEVRDTGVGIPKDMQQNIFNSFVQVDASITRQYGGTGLGLTIVKEFTEMMGGTVGLDSVVGKGSLFWFEITLAKAEQQEINVEQNGLEGLSVLLVDDVPTNRKIFTEHLRNWGAEPTSVSSGQEALDTLSDAFTHGTNFDLILLDWFMPKMDGLTLASTLNDDPRFNSIPVVMLSSYSISQEKLDRAGVAASLTKPIRSSSLKKLLIETVSKFEISGKKLVPQLKEEKPLVLLAEDNDVNALIAQTMLEDEGIEIQHVEDGKKAVEAVKQRKYTLILMDIHMPDVDGYTATKLIREWERSHQIEHIPIIAMTANALKGDREKCLQLGMDDYLAKPVRREDLLKKVKMWMQNTKQEHQEEAPA